MSTLYYPAKEDLEAWILGISEALSWGDAQSLISWHQGLHKVFGNAPNEALLNTERRLSSALRNWGIEHRERDALSEAAGTLVENPAPPSVDEVMMYLGYQEIPLHSGVVQLVQAPEGSDIYLRVDPTVVGPDMQKIIMKTLQKQMPAGIKLKNLPRNAKDDFAVIHSAMDLTLSRSPQLYAPAVVPWSSLLADVPEVVLKDGHVRIDVKGVQHVERVVKSAESETVCEHYVLGPVLFPEREDADGHIHSKEVVRKACYWWAEHSRANPYEVNHVLHGGTRCEAGDIVQVENYIMPVDANLNGQEIPEGTWMHGAVVRNPEVWQKMLEQGVQAWSIEADAWVTEEPKE